MRTRDLKPDFWTDERIVSVSDGAKLMFQGLWCLADREGRLEDKPITIGLKVRPWDAKSTPKFLAELAEAGLIVRYQTEHGSYIGLPGFTTHQRVHPREMESKLPDWAGLEVSRGKVDLSAASSGKKENSALSSEPAGSSSTSEPAGSSGPTSAPSALMPGPVDLAHAWNTDTSPPLPRVTLPLSKGRDKAATAALARRALPAWRQVFARVNASVFCRGSSDSKWVADFDWAIRPDGAKPEPATKVLEGAYDRAQGPPAREAPVYAEGRQRL